MIAAAHRFHGHASLRYVYQNGRTVRTSQLSLRYAPNQRRSSYRAAVVISKKVAKSAVARNRVRRRLYEKIRLSAPQFQGAYDLVFTVLSPDTLELTSDELGRAVTQLLLKSGVTPTP